MNKSSQRAISCLILAPLLSSCSGYRQERDELARNRSKWATQKINRYRYTFAISCFCGPEATEPVQVEVLNSVPIQVTRVRPVQYAPLRTQDFGRYYTVEELFQLAQTTLDSGPDKISIRYDPTLGYPTSISVDQREEVSDDEMYYSATQLEISSRE